MQFDIERKVSASRFTRMVPGMSNLETLVPMLYSEGVAKGRISISRWVDLTATNAAKIFGMYPRKGAIVEGADADLVVFDPNRKVTINSREMHSRADYDPFMDLFHLIKDIKYGRWIQGSAFKLDQLIFTS